MIMMNIYFYWNRLKVTVVISNDSSKSSCRKYHEVVTMVIQNLGVMMSSGFVDD